ncbi:MAG: T9SS type A sorting domain-containing protein [Flavipsychrobacter sp.]
MTYNNVVNGGIYSNATTASLTITNAMATSSSTLFRCVLGGSCPPGVTSAPRLLVVNVRPTINVHPVDRVICDGGSTTFDVNTSGTSLTFQWQVSTNGGGTWTNLTNTGIHSNTTTPSLSVTAATTAANNNQYRCIVSGVCTPSVTSTARTLTVHTLPAITANPTNKNVCDGSNTTFSVTTTGTGISYQWQVSTNSGTTWTNVTNIGIYSGSNTATLALTGASLAINGYQYRCMVNSVCAPSVTSTAATLTMLTLPGFTAQPVNSVICLGSNASFSVSATGTAVTYQWQVSTNGGGTWSNVSNGGVYSGATTATLNLAAPAASFNNNQYRCIISGSCTPSVTSNARLLTVNTPPAITGNPSNNAICDGNNVSFSCSATGTGITYQWQANTGSGFTNISNGSSGTGGFTYNGATSSTLSITNANLGLNNAQFRCVVSGASPCTPATTSSATLIVHPILTPALTITASDTDICVNTSVTFTVVSTTNPGPSPSFQWKRNGTNVGSNSTSYTSSGLANGDVITCVMTSSVPCPSPASVTSNTKTMIVHPRPVPSITISGPPGDSVCDTRAATFTVTSTVNGGANPIYQWQVNGVNTGVAATTFTTNTLVNGDVVSCRLTSSALCATPMVVSSAGINMKVTPLTFATGRIQATPTTNICEGDTVNVFCYYTNGGPTPTFDWYINGNKVANNPFASLQSSTLKNGDTVQCIFTNSFSCPEPVITNKEIFTVNKVEASSVSIVANPSVLVPGMPTTITAVPVNGGANPTYIWRRSGQVVAGVTGDTYVVNDLLYLDKIQVTMKPDHPCKVNEFESSNTLVVNQPNSVQNTVNGADELGLYPNPNNGEFTIEGTFAGVNGATNISIYNNLGQKVHTATTDVVNGKLTHKLSLNGKIAPGLYTLSIEVDGQVYTRRFNIVE